MRMTRTTIAQVNTQALTLNSVPNGNPKFPFMELPFITQTTTKHVIGEAVDIMLSDRKLMKAILDYCKMDELAALALKTEVRKYER